MTRIRTLDFLPTIFQTPTNSQFLGATLDQLVNPPVTRKIEGYVGSKLGYGVDATDYYVVEPDKVRKDYQLEPGIVFTKENETTAKDFISYPGILDALKLQNGIINNNDRLFNSQFYSWDSFTDLDKIINYNQYYWLPEGPPPVIVSSDIVFKTNDYIVTDQENTYNIRTLGAGAGTSNPTITMLRGGTYTFSVNQNSQFWIQGEPGVTGFSPTQTNLYTRDVFGVTNNGSTTGVITFNVPQKDAQNNFNFPGNNLVDLVCNKPFSQVNGLLLSQLKNIDGVTALNGRTVLFFNGLTNEIADLGSYDVQQYSQTYLPIFNNVQITGTEGQFSCDSTTITVGTEIQVNGIFDNDNIPDEPAQGSINGYTGTQKYYIVSTNGTTTFQLSATLGGVPIATTIGQTRGVAFSINPLTIPYDTPSYTSLTSDNFYTITYLPNPGDNNDPFVVFIPTGLIPIEQKITVNFGTQFIGLNFYKSTTGLIQQIPYLSAPLDTLYYQDGTNPNKVGVIKLIENNDLNTINVENDILGKPNYTSTNGVVFTNGLKVEFDGDILPTSYLTGQYYVEGVGTAIQLIPVESLIIPEPFTSNSTIPYDSLPYDIGNFDGTSFIPLTPDYITIARNAINKNAWSRSNRWFHIDVINSTANYNNNPNIATTFATPNNKAKRPIIEFYPNLKLFNSGIVGKDPVDYIDQRTTDAFSLVSGQAAYYPDVETYTSYTGVINTNPLVNVGDFFVNQQYLIQSLGDISNNRDTKESTWVNLGAKLALDGEFVIGREYVITHVGDTNWNSVGYVGIPDIGDIFTATASGNDSGTGRAIERLFTATGTGNYNSAFIEAGLSYTITELGTTQWINLGAQEKNTSEFSEGTQYVITYLGQTDWNAISDSSTRSWGNGSPTIGGIFIKNAYPASFDGLALETTFDATVSGGIGTGTAKQGDGLTLAQTVTTIEIDKDDVVGNLYVGQYINDLILNEQSRLPPDTRILQIEGTDTLTITVFWLIPLIVNSGNNASFVADSKNNADLLLYSGSTVIFANDENEFIRNKIYVANINNTGSASYPVITLTEAVDGLVLDNDQINILRGFNNQGKSYWFNGLNYIEAQFKQNINQAPLFDVFDKNGISFSDQQIYNSTTFKGSKLFSYKPGVGIDDPILGFPISFSSINNVGDITFDVNLNDDKFDYVIGTDPITQNVNTGYIYNYSDRDVYTRELGWQTAVAPSVQYQVFEFNYEANEPPVLITQQNELFYSVTCDVPQLSVSDTIWPSLQVYNNNTLLKQGTDYFVVNNTNSTEISIKLTKDVNTVFQVLILSNKVSNNAYYSIPINLSNNPFNTDITTVDIGDIRGHYQTIFQNNPNTEGVMFGSNNYRDLGNMVPWGNRIIQNSASLVLPGAFLRTSNHNLFDALLFNSREYIKFKNLLVDTVSKIDFQQRFNPAFILDEALDQITSVKNQDMPFFWSDMIPNKAAFITNTYKFENQLDTGTFGLSKVYNFDTANYDGVLVYLSRKIQGTLVTRQLLKDIEYVVSTDTPSLTININLENGDNIIIKEYNQTYGSYIPNTPTKLGLYPVTIPAVLLDKSYSTPTYFIIGHDGSYNKLYGEYNEELQMLVDYRDQALFEFETRVFNNLKLSNVIPIQEADIVPGFFRNTKYSYNEWIQVYSTTFLDWIGQNRLNYKQQLYLPNDQYSYNYRNSANKLDNKVIEQGYWRGIYQYFYDTTTPDTTPWEMIGYTNKPVWWEDRYGPAPYTSSNLILWQDMENGIDYNNGDPIVLPQYKRPGLLTILSVNDQGNLISPLNSIVGNYNPNGFQKDWRVGDDGPVELSYRRSSTYPFDLMRLEALANPARFFNLGSDVDNYKYNTEFNQFLVNDRSHIVPSEIEIYGNGTAKTSYINWIVDYEKQLGVNATENIEKLLRNLDARLVYRLAGFSDKTLLKFFVEKGSPETRNPSLLIPDESYQVLLYENQAYDRLVYSSVIIQVTAEGYTVYGNSQNFSYFRVLKPILNGNTREIRIQDQRVKIAVDYSNTVEIIPYGTIFYSVQELSQFLMSYGTYLETQGSQYTQIEGGIAVNWQQMVAEFLYWTQVGWEIGSVVTLNPNATELKIDKENQIVQPLTIRQTNFVLNQNLYPINNVDLDIFRNGTEFAVKPLNQGDTIAYAQFNLSNLEHGVVFDNETLFNDVIYNLVSGLKQNRIFVRGTKSAEWNGTLFASGFIYNQDNIQEWVKEAKYTKGSIVKFKNKFWTALNIIQPNSTFNEREWKETEYNEIQKGLLPNSSTRSFESTLYYDANKANLEQDADLLSFSLIGFRPRDYMESADLTDITQVNIYKNMIKEKGTRNVISAFKGANLPQGEIDYQIYENWAIKSGQFGGTLNQNFIEMKLQENKLTGNPFIVGLTDGNDVPGAQQLVPLNSLFNYGRPVDSSNVFPTVTDYVQSTLFPDAGYVNFNDVKMSAYFYSNLPAAINQNGLIVPINNFYVRDYVWLANYLGKWQVLTPVPNGQVTQVRSNLNNTATVTFKQPHNLQKFDILSIVNFDSTVNGYYIALEIVNPYQIIIDLSLNVNQREVTGQGICLTYNSQRVEQPSDIQNLPLLDSEFTKNTVWVDKNNDGSWAVYRKDISYKYDTEFNIENSETFGSAVAYTKLSDYLFGDSSAGRVYRFQYDPITKEYEADQVLTGDTSFGSTIVHQQNIFAISQPTTDSKVYLYTVNDTTITDDVVTYQDPIIAPLGSTNFGHAIAMSGDTNWLYISDFDEDSISARNNVHVYRKKNILTDADSLIDGETYQITEIGTTDWTLLGAVENKVGIYFIANNVLGEGTGKAVECSYEFITTIDNLSTDIDKFGSSISTNYYGTTLVVGAPNTNFDVNVKRWGRAYVYQRIDQNIEVQVGSTTGPTNLSLVWTPNISEPTPQVYVKKNGVQINSDQYSITGSTLVYNGPVKAGDIINVSGNKFTLIQQLTTEQNPRIGVQFGYSLDNNNYASEILVGAPFALNSINQEGAVYRYTNGSAKFGTIIGTNEVNVTTPKTLLLNGFNVTIPIGNATIAANAINTANITNIQALAMDNKLIISVIDQNLTQTNQKLVIGVTDTDTLAELGLTIYTQTQTILCPHESGPTQFGTVVKFNEHNSVAISAPVGTRFAQTTFDFSDDENLDNDTIFDNNATQFIDSIKNVGAVYLFDYLSNHNESLSNIGAFTYAQSVNSQSLVNGSQPRYGLSIDFNENKVVVGAPYYRPEDIDGQVIVYVNDTGITNWSEFRQSNPIVDINRVDNMQLFSMETNNTLVNLDYVDPLQGKILGAVRQNIDVISNIDPAKYNNSNDLQSGFVWGSSQVGSIWFDTTNIRYVNYHQNDNSYNARYWGTLFPGSDVAIYSWIASNVAPADYIGPGLPRDINLYSVQTTINSSGIIVPVYYFWVRNSGLTFRQQGKTLADVTIASYIANPTGSGISYLAPLAPNAVALYNSQTYINDNDTVLHIGFSTSTNEDPGHQEFTLIRENFADDFLPGVPKSGISAFPESLYDRLLDSLSGIDEQGQVVPNPFLPKAVQSGVLARPRQSFFYNRFTALQNYLQFANSVMKQYPITEIRNDILFLYKAGPLNPSTVDNPEWTNGPELFYDTTQYWEFVNWWAEGFDDNTKAALQVPIYADLSALTVSVGTIVNVAQNSKGLTETYRYDGDGIWTRIGLQNGTIRFKDELYDYENYNIGFDGDFFASATFDQFPSEETRWIVRALTEQIYTNELLIFRNRSLILLFEYIQAETIENQNYLPWLNKTSLVDVSHKIRELIPIQNFKSDNQEFLSGYVNEAKPYHVVIKEFLFEYTGQDDYEGNITDFDLPAQYSNTIDKFVTPELVYRNPNTAYEFLPEDGIWQEQRYNQWFQNYGVSFTGQQNFAISKLSNYLTKSSTFILIDNVQGFPINGTIKIANIDNPSEYELITYNSVDRALGILTGLVRGVNGTTISDHLPGEMIYMDLEPVVLLNSGKNYSNPPRVIATIDLTEYPPPKEEAILEAVMSLDKVIGITVVNPGLGYPVAPDIRIDASETYTFNSNQVNSVDHTIIFYAPTLATGDLIRYVAETDDNIGKLENDQWYYINVLNSSPNTIIALYTSLADAINDRDRIEIFAIGNNTTHRLEIGARATAITNSYPVRENNITLRYDRTTYNSQITEWTPNTYYGSSYVDSLLDSASSDLQLSSLQPDINNLLSSAQGTVFPITNIENESITDWSSFERSVGNISNNKITLSYNSSNNDNYPSGSTIGFTVDMPICFEGDVANSGLSTYNIETKEGTIYYVNEIFDLESFDIKDENGNLIPLGTYNPIDLKCFTAKIINTAIVTTDYPGIRTVTKTNDNNIITIPLNEIGTGGTDGLYTNCPVIFTGNVFGGIEENFVYYVTSVLDSQNFTISTAKDPLTIKVLATTIANQLIVESELGLNRGDPIVFNNIVINGQQTTSFGNIQSGVIYYVLTVNPKNITISETPNGSVYSVGIPVNASNNTYAYLYDQINTVKLSSATGNMTVNISLPVSPGQVNGQKFSFYSSSGQYEVNILPNYYGNLVEKIITKTLANENLIFLSNESDGTENMYIGFTFRVNTSIGGLNTTTTYNIEEIGLSTINVIATASSVTIGLTTYNNVLRADTDAIANPTDFIYEGMPITFTNGIGGINPGDIYYVKEIINNEYFIVENDQAVVPTLLDSVGNMFGTGESYVVPNVSVTDDTGPARLDQYITSNPTLSISYQAGGYTAVIVNGGQGFTINNTITVPGTLIGGSTPNNDLTMIVDTIQPIVAGEYIWSLPIESNGVITNLICNGDPNDIVNNYYLKVISGNQFKVYSDPLLTVPVTGINFPYIGITSTTASEINTNVITLANVNGFAENDAVVFTGQVFGNIVLGKTYYIGTILSNTITLLSKPNGTVVTLTDSTGIMTMAKIGSVMILPEPFYFNPNIVKYNNRVWLCIISNNDDEFVFGKWQELNSGDYRLNAMDRVIGYYNPSPNMPGVDLTQLFTGITYPNSIYKGNNFEPDLQYEVDTILKDQPFYPRNLNIPGVVFNGLNYVAPVNHSQYSGFIADIEVADDWLLGKLSSTSLNLTGIDFADNKYVVTSTNNATPILRSNDNKIWTVNGFYIPFGTIVEDIEFEKIKLNASNLSLNSVSYGNNKWLIAGENTILISDDTALWFEVYKFTGNMYTVQYIESSNFTGYLAAGFRNEGPTNSTPIIVKSLNGIIWNEDIIFDPNPIGSIYRFATNGNILVGVGENGGIYTSVDSITWELITSPTNEDLNDITYENGLFLVVGNNGVVLTSINGTDWIDKSYTTSNNLNSINYLIDSNTFTIVGDNNTILQTNNISTMLIDWDTTQIFSVPPTPYTVKGDPFLSGYGPEELVPGIVSDQLTMIVNTRPGTNWPITEYAHSGYNVVSIEIPNQSDNLYSFKNLVQTPFTIFVGLIENNLSKTLYENIDFTVDWVNKIVIPNQTLTVGQSLRIDAYEAGNGDQLVKANTETDPLRLNSTTGYQELYLNCNYSALRYNGGGIVQDVFGSVGEFYTEPAVYHNGIKLLPGKTSTVTSTLSSNNAVVTFSTNLLNVGQKITFSDTMFGNILPHTTYYVKQILNSTQFTISETLGGSEVVLANANGSALFVTNDYAAALQPNQIAAKIIFAKEYDLTNDYIAYAFYGETEPLQYGYSLPQTQVFELSTSQTVFDLDNKLGAINSKNAIVEINGIRQTESLYSINSFNKKLTFNNSIPNGSVVAVTTYNDTERQYLNTQYGITSSDSNFVNVVIESTNFVSTAYDEIPFAYDTTLYDGNLYYLTLGSGYNTNVLAVNDVIVFKNVSLGGVILDKTYYVAIIYDSSSFAISETIGGPIVELTNDTGLMSAVVSFITVANIIQVNNNISFPLAQPKVQSTSTLTQSVIVDDIANIIENQPVLFRAPIINVSEAVNKTYQIQSLGNTDWAAMGWVPETLGDTPQVGDVFLATGPGTGTGRILLASYGGLSLLGTTYFIDTVDVGTLSFTLKDQNNNPIPIGTETGTNLFVAQVGGVESVQITTGIPHNFVENSKIQIDGILGSVQLNNNVYYTHIINDFIFAIYSQPFSPAINASNSPVTLVSTYIGSGWVWIEGLFTISLTTATSTNSVGNKITVASTEGLVVNTPVYFTQYDKDNGDVILGGLIEGQEYFVKDIGPNIDLGLASDEFTISETRDGSAVVLTTETGLMKVSQWQQNNVERLYVTINGYRVPNSNLRLNENNNLSILATIEAGDEVIITSMIPSATPDELVYIQLVNKENQGSVYRANTETRTWLTRNIVDLDTKIYVHDISKLTNLKIQTNTVEPATFGFHNIGLNVNKVDLLQVEVFNNTTDQEIDPNYLQIEVTPLGPFIKIQEGSWISDGDSVTITSLEGGTVFINGEFMRFTSVSITPTINGDYECDVIRGSNGSGVPANTPKYSEVFSLLDDNRMTEINYNRTWNSNSFNTVEGDPLQISTTQAARFLKVDR